MRLDKLLKGYKSEVLKKSKEDENKIDEIRVDSRQVEKYDLFICIKGENFDSHNSLQYCYNKGVRNFIVEENNIYSQIFDKNDVNIIKVQCTRDFLAYASNIFFKNQSEKFTSIGITGTNGKTSTTYFIEKILLSIEKKVGSIGTLGIKIDGNNTNQMFSTSTTPDTLDLQKIYKVFLENEVSHIVMEVSSHGLELKRVNYNKFKIGIFTNLTQDHLDFHNTIEEYYLSKKKLFKLCEKALINTDCTYGKRLSRELKEEGTCKVIEVSKYKKTDYHCKNIISSINKVSYTIKTKDEKRENININIPGDFTVDNTLMAIATCCELGINIEEIKKSIEKIKGVPGRIQPVENNRGLNVFIDYAHTPEALQMVIESVKKNIKGKVIVIFGCGGDRDKAKRALMGEIGSRRSDVCIITSDNPRTEDENEIIEDILSGIKDRDSVIVERNRQEAIKIGIKKAAKDDAVIIAGKGHEDYQIIGEIKHNFSDYKSAQKIMEEN